MIAFDLVPGAVVRVIHRMLRGSILVVALVALNIALAASVARGGDGPNRRIAQTPSPKVDQPSPPPGPPGPARSKILSDTGLTLDQAVDRLLTDNLELRVLRDEIRMAVADVEAAGQPPLAELWIRLGKDGIKTRTIQLRELLPRSWIEIPVARAARRVMEAQYDDAVRSRKDNLYTAFVDVEEAEMRVTQAKARLQGMQTLSSRVQAFSERGLITQADFAAVKTERELAASALGEDETTLHKVKLTLANLLNLPDAESQQLKIQPDLEQSIARDQDVPPVEELIRRALMHRPDVRSYRLGLQRAQLDWLKALLEPLSQIRMRVWPDHGIWAGARPGQHAPADQMSAIVTLPASVRNCGMLRRAAINVGQTRTELAKVERLVILEVRQARLEYDQSRATVGRFRQDILPNARTGLDRTLKLFQEGETTMASYLEAQEKSNTLVHQYRSAAIRLRRSKLALNTAVGERILP
jgi:cobalt-zinc-cadmium efflux system outer membrane protein